MNNRLSMNRYILFALLLLLTVASCGRRGIGSSVGGELTGVPVGKVWSEPTPYNMVLVSRGSYTMGAGQIDSLWGITIPSRGVSVDDFWMDETEITNSQYKQFVYWVRDSIIRERLADPAYAGDDFYKITEDEYGEPITHRLNWSLPIPWKLNTEEEEAAINSLYTTHPITGKTMLDVRQLNYRYEWFDATEAAREQYGLGPTGLAPNRGQADNRTETVMITKDTAYIAPDGRIVNETITRPFSGLHDFVHTRIVNIYPDTTCWVNDFPEADNERYLRHYFSHPAYAHHPVVGVSWEQATAFCEWRTLFLRRSINRDDVIVERYRLPTEAEWEMAAQSSEIINESGCFQANFKSGEGGYAADNHLITAKVRSFKPNLYGLYDMVGNVAEWTATDYTEAGNKLMGDMNPQYRRNPSGDDFHPTHRKVVKGGSWKDIYPFIRPDLRDSEQPNQGRSYIGFRCVRTRISTGD